MITATAQTWAAAVQARLCEIAAALHGRPAGPAVRAALARLTDGAFPLPLDDPRYRHNTLNPGGLPIEVSFCEDSPRALRCDSAPGGPDATASHRQAAVVATAAISAEQLRVWQPHVATNRFGGFASAVIPDDAMPVSYKAYLELARNADIETVGANRPWRTLAELLPGLQPHFVALSAPPAPARLYFECTAGLALPALVDWAGRHGLTRQALTAAHIVRRLTDGTVILPEAGLLCAVGQTARGGIELKLELTQPVLSDRALEAIRAVLMARPRSESAFEHWCAAVGAPIRPTVVSVRICTAHPEPRLNVYTGLTL
jgi:hypothetical protein